MACICIGCDVTVSSMGCYV